MSDIAFNADLPAPRVRRLRYSGSGPSRLWRGAAIALTFAVAGCSVDLDMISKSERPETTGSVRTANDAMAAADLPPEADLVLTREAVNEVLTRGKDTSVPWENPATGARGTVTAIAAAYTIDKAQCRDFLASYVHDGKQSWLRGEACREDRGKWEVRALKPWIRS